MENNKRISYTDNKGKLPPENPSRGCYKNGVFNIWRCKLQCGESNGFSFTEEELEVAIKRFHNQRYALFKFLENLDYQNIEHWIKNAPKEISEKRRNWWENDTEYGKNSAGETLAIESMIRVVENLYYKIHNKNIYENY